MSATKRKRWSTWARRGLSVVCAFLCLQAQATDFPVGTVFVNIVFTTACTNITGTGMLSGASATRAGSDFVISVPAGGVLVAPMTITVTNIPTTTLSNQTALPATVSVTGAETILGASGFGLLQLQNGIPVASGTSLSFFGGGCQLVFTVSGNNPLDSTAVENSPSSAVSQSSSALSRTTSGVFVDASRAAGVALDSLAGRRNSNRFSLNGSGARFNSRGAGASEPHLPIGFWGSAAYTSSDDDSASTPTETTRWHGVLGVDLTHQGWLVTGIALGYEHDDTDTTYNSGNIETNGTTVVGYIGALLTENLSLDVSAGRSFLNSDQFRTSGTSRITSEVDVKRVFLAGNANYGWTYDNWNMSVRAGALWLEDSQDSFTESDGTTIAGTEFDIGRVNLGAEVAYSIGRFEPYIGATHNHTFSQSSSTASVSSLDKSDTLLNMGTRFFGSDTLSGNVEFSKLLGRKNVDEFAVQFLLRSDF